MKKDRIIQAPRFSIDGVRALEFIHQLNFVRLGGTAAEREAAGMIVSKLRAMGLSPKIEPFIVHTYDTRPASFEVVSPYSKSYNVFEVGFTGKTPKKGVEGELVFIEELHALDPGKMKGKIPIIYMLPLYEVYKKLPKSGAKAFILVVDPSAYMFRRRMPHMIVEAFGKVPGVTLHFEAGMDLYAKKAVRARITTDGHDYEGRSGNVIAEIKGTELPDEKILICAHYDSVEQSPGAIDNGAGSATIMEIARHFAKHPPKRSIIFAWFGCEEHGLYGSYNYVVKHKKELSKLKLVVNSDLGGPVFGVNTVTLCGSEGLKAFAGAVVKERGAQFTVNEDIFSSDNTYFNEYGIPSASFYRYGGAYGHTPFDQARLLCPEALATVGGATLEFMSRVANAVEIPFVLTIEGDSKKARDRHIANRRKQPLNRPLLCDEKKPLK